QKSAWVVSAWRGLAFPCAPPLRAPARFSCKPRADIAPPVREEGMKGSISAERRVDCRPTRALLQRDKVGRRLPPRGSCVPQIDVHLEPGAKRFHEVTAVYDLSLAINRLAFF